MLFAPTGFCDRAQNDDLTGDQWSPLHKITLLPLASPSSPHPTPYTPAPPSNFLPSPNNVKIFALFFIVLQTVWLTPLTHAQGINPEELPIWDGSISSDTVKLPNISKADTVKNSLQTTGSKSLQTSVGNGGADIQQELRLSIQGNASEDVFVNAYLVDVGRPAGSEITASLREVDAVYIGIENKNIKGELGDITVDVNNVNLWNFHRSALGTRGILRNDNGEIFAAYGTDKTTHQTIFFNGNPSQQKGYLLFGETSTSEGNNAFGVIVPHSERVYLNGVLLVAGEDYELNDAGGVLDFLGTIIPNPKDEIRVEFDSYGSEAVKETRAAAGSYRTKFLWFDLAALNLRDTLISEKRLGARFRAGNGYLFGDVETAMNENDKKSLKWFFESDSNSRQKQLFKIAVKGEYADSGFVAGNAETGRGNFAGAGNEWDNYILRDKWLLDSVPNGDLRYDEVTANLKLGNWSPGIFVGHRDFKSVRGEGFLKHENEIAGSEINVGKVKRFTSDDTKIISEETQNEIWQGEIQSKYLQGKYRPYGNFYVESDEDFRSIYGIEYGNKNQGAFAFTEIAKEKDDTTEFSQWKNFIIFNGKNWHSNTLFQIRGDEGLKSYLLDQSAAYNAPNSAVQGNVNYAFNYTNEIPWVAIYRRVPSGTGDVLYDSLTGKYISGVDNGDFMYEGMGRSDSLPAERTYKNYLKWETQIIPSVIAGKENRTNGFINDITLFANGEWLRHSTEKLLDLENSVLWEQPQKKGSLMLTVNNRLSTEPQTLATEKIFSQTADAHYTARKDEDWNFKIIKEAAEFSFSELEWNSWAGEFSWLRTLAKGFSVQPFYSQKYTEGFYFEENWNATLRQSGVNGRWQGAGANLAQIGVSGNFVEKSGDVAPYSSVDGFEKGFSWRANALAQIAFGKNFILSANYVVRKYHDSIFQKLTSEAKAVF